MSRLNWRIIDFPHHMGRKLHPPGTVFSLNVVHILDRNANGEISMLDKYFHVMYMYLHIFAGLHVVV